MNNTADAGKRVEDDARDTLIEIDALCHSYEEFKRLAAEESPYAPPSGSMELWSAWRNLCEHFASRPHYPKPQAIATLLSQKVGQLQIATIYGWHTDKGAPDIEKVTEEMANPGKHYDPDKWQHPAKASKKRLVDAAWAERRTTRDAKFDVRGVEKFEKFIPPSLDAMVKAGAPASQISNVHKISIEEAEQLLIEAGTEPKREIVPANASVAHLERMMAEANSAQPLPSKLAGSKLLQEV